MRVLSDKQIEEILQKLAKCEQMVDKKNQELSAILSEIVFIIGGEKSILSVNGYLARHVIESED